MKGANVAVASGRRREALDKGGRTVYNDAPSCSPLVKTDKGWHISRSSDRRPARRERPAPGRLSASGAGRSR